MELKGVTFLCEEPVDEDLMKALPEDLQEFYSDKNGLIAFNGGLQIRSCTASDSWHSLNRFWRGANAFYKTYPNLFNSDIPFAQDCLGDQFFLREDTIWILSTETGEVIDMEVDLDEFIQASVDDPVEYLAMEPLVSFMDLHGDLPPGELVHIVPGLSLDLPDDTTYHLDSLPVEERLNWLKAFYKENRST